MAWHARCLAPGPLPAYPPARRATMNEPDVTLTDYALALECAIFVLLLARRPERVRPLHDWFILLLASLGVAALAGGTVHGFLSDPLAWYWAALWSTVLVAVGVTALSAWAIGAHLMCSDRLARWVTILAAVQFVLYAWVVLILRDFRVAVLNYLPATVFLLISLLVAYRRRRQATILAGVGGLALTFVAAGVQLGGVALHPVYFDHNALYHLLQGIAVALVFLAARALTARVS